ncbi:hypothetical protein HPB51_013962 [Rhipicephalus microplus]|uniref:Uncharacterized protein n=1 Tax=Rhipicephalus microplus TaxID=6941 RepID=A0A9J6DGP5_RHIMP|nr:hypothetical protein HPB51_013962 [Rhipicephalus microplus]
MKIYFHCNLSNPSHKRCLVPPSCCRADSSYTGIFCGRDVLNLSDHEAWFRVHTGSCPDAANRFLKEHVMIIGGVCLIAVIVLAFIDMVTNAVIEEIDIIRKLYDHVRVPYASWMRPPLTAPYLADDRGGPRPSPTDTDVIFAKFTYIW